MKRSSSAVAGMLCAAVLATGCGGGDDGAAEAIETGESAGSEGETAGSEGETAQEAVEDARMPDVIGMPKDEAVALLEDLGFVVGTGIVRTTEMEPDLVYRSEPAPDRKVQEGQRITLRIAGEPRS